MYIGVLFDLRKCPRGCGAAGKSSGGFWVESKRQPLSLEIPEELEKSGGGGVVSGKKIQVVQWQVDKHLIKSLHLRNKKRLL